MGGGATLLVRRSKTDGEGSGEIVYLACDTVRLVRAWLARSGITEGRLFRSVAKSGQLGERLDPSQVPRIFKAMADRAGLPEALVQGLSGHSARVGAAQDMIAAGIELPAILQAGRWKSTAMVNRYGERLLARRSGAAQRSSPGCRIGSEGAEAGFASGTWDENSGLGGRDAGESGALCARQRAQPRSCYREQ